MTDPTPTPEQMESLEDALARGKKLEAIKIYRVATGSGLKESKEFIDALSAKLLEQDPERYAPLAASQRSGCMALLLALISVSALLLACIGVMAASAAPDQPPVPWAPEVVSDGRQVPVSTAAELIEAFDDLQDGDTILLADGLYEPARTLQIDGVRNVSIHGASRDPEQVVWRGRGWAARDRPNELLRIARVDGVDIGWITFEEAHMYGVKVEAENHPANVHIHHCHFRDIGVRHIKGSTSLTGRATTGSIRFCSFENTRIPPEDWLFQGNYVTAIDMMALEDWVIADNTFRNLKGRTGNGRAAIFIWVQSRGVVVERNVIIHCDRGIAFGNPSDSTIADPDGAPTMHLTDGVCRNNIIVPGPDAGIEIARVANVRIQHNTIYRPDRPADATWWSNRGIRMIQGIQGVEVANNLVHNGVIQCETPDGQWQDHHNLAGRFADWFVDPPNGDLRLTETVVQAMSPAPRLADVPTDIAGVSRSAETAAGAWEATGAGE